MALEDLTGVDKFVANLVITNPLSADDRREGDDHIRGIKNVLKNSFPGLAGPVRFGDYVLKAGDTMTGPLTVGTLGGANTWHTGNLFALGVLGISSVPGSTFGDIFKVAKEGTAVKLYFFNSVSHAIYYDNSSGILGIGTGGGNFLFNNDGDTAMKKNAGLWAAVSDSRIKERIEDYTPGLKAVLKLRPRVYSFKAETGYDPTERHVGMLSQEAFAAMPDTVNIGRNRVGDIELDDMGTFNPTNIQYALVNAIKTLSERIAALEKLAEGC